MSRRIQTLSRISTIKIAQSLLISSTLFLKFNNILIRINSFYLYIHNEEPLITV
jgi:hypothetical protein